MTITNELARLGSLSADDIAAEFRAKGIRGRFGNCGICPMANYLRACTGQAVAVTPVGVKTAGGVFYDVPQSVTDFVMRFDQHKLLDLIGDWP